MVRIRINYVLNVDKWLFLESILAIWGPSSWKSVIWYKPTIGLGIAGFICICLLMNKTKVLVFRPISIHNLWFWDHCYHELNVHSVYWQVVIP